MEIPLYDDAIGSVELIETWGNDATPAHSARVSFARDAWKSSEEITEKDEKLIKYLADHKHTTPFEHVGATLRITAPIFVARQIMRHRTFSYNEVSRRYTDQEIECWRPTSLRAQSNKSLQCSSSEPVRDEIELLNAMDASIDMGIDTYQALIEAGVAREIARAVLPVSLYTTWWQSGNLNAWAHLLRLRLDTHSQPETQELAQGIREILMCQFPQSLSALLTT